MEIKEGSKVGFVGASGCGKSTIFQLLQRFYEPNSGHILVDGLDIRDYDIHHLRTTFAMVSQEPILFNDTIANNIRYNLPSVSQEDLLQAATQSNFNPDDDNLHENRTPSS